VILYNSRYNFHCAHVFACLSVILSLVTFGGFRLVQVGESNFLSHTKNEKFLNFLISWNDSRDMDNFWIFYTCHYSGKMPFKRLKYVWAGNLTSFMSALFILALFSFRSALKECRQCHQPLSESYYAELIHQFSPIAGYLHLNG